MATFGAISGLGPGIGDTLFVNFDTLSPSLA
jgi:hypothetical protein